RVDVHKPLKTMGLDSLMAVELRNRLENSLGVTLSATLVFNYPTIALMVPYAAGKMGISLEGDGVVETAGDSAPAPAVPDLDVSTISQLSDEDAEALLLQELEDLDF